MLLSEAISEFLAVRRVKLGQLSQATYEWQLEKFLDWCHSRNVVDTEKLSVVVLSDYMEWLKTTPTARGTLLTSKSMVSYYKILHVLLKWLVDEDMASSRLLRLPAPQLEAKIPGTLNGGQVLKMVRATSESTGRVMQARDAAITLLLADCGLRASELCNLTLDQLREDHVLVLGKGNKWREVGPLSSRTQRALRAYLTTWRPKQKPTCDNLFVCRGGEAFTRNALGKLIRRLRRHAGVEERVHPHTFRHSYARNQALAGADVLAISRLLGHSSLTVTQAYLGAFSSSDARRQVHSVVDNL